MSEHPSGRDSQQERGFTIQRRGRWPVFAALVAVVVVAVAGFALLGGDDEAAVARDGATMKVSYTPGDPAQAAIIDYVAETLGPEHGVQVEGVEIGDSNQLNRAVSEGQLAGSIYQHAEWLGQVLQANPDFRLEAGTRGIFHWKFGIWSDRYADPAQLPDGATISIPPDPANQAIALAQLDKAGLIAIDPGVAEGTATLRDISNPHRFEWKQIELASQARSFTDVDAVVGSFEYFLMGGIPLEKAIFAPLPPDQFAGVLTIGSDFRDSENVRRLVAAFSDPRLDAFIRSDPRVRRSIASVHG